MAGNDSQKQLLTLIREFASEKSHKERSLSGLRKKIEELRKECEAASSVLENLKHKKEIVEQEVKGCEVELAMADASTQALEKRNAKLDAEISAVGLGIDELKKMEESIRGEFIKEMLEKNAEIRMIQGMSSIEQNKDQSILSSRNGLKQAIEEETEFDSITIQKKLAEISSKMSMEKEQYLAEQCIYNQTQGDLAVIEEKLSLMEEITKKTKELEELANKQTTEVEEVCASLCEELQKMSKCPICHEENLEALQELLL